MKTFLYGVKLWRELDYRVNMQEFAKANELCFEIEVFNAVHPIAGWIAKYFH